MDIRPIRLKEDMRAVERIWQECGWVEGPEQSSHIRHFLGTGRCTVGCLNGTPECAVHTVPGTIHYLDQPLRLSAVTAVTTSRIARKQGLARLMTARQLASAAADGAQVAALGMFDQGFYDQLGFGTGAYEHTFRFDPTTLLVAGGFSVPSRIHKDEWQAVHQAMLNRQKHHGAITLTPPELMKGELAWQENGFGLGYYEGDALTHFFWADAKDEYGPYEITYLAYRSAEELRELLALIRSLGDQVTTVVMHEPAHVQLQTLLAQPFRHRRMTRNSRHENVHRSNAYWQVRILDLDGCLRARHWPGAEVVFNLELSDPVADFLPEEGWQGLGGTYTVRIGASSSATTGATDGLPVLRASVNAFSRLFFGIVNATGQCLSGDFHAPDELIGPLDEAFCLPRMTTSWDF